MTSNGNSVNKYIEWDRIIRIKRHIIVGATKYVANKI